MGDPDGAEDRKGDGDMSLPQRLPYELLQTQWAEQLNPILANPIMQGLAITGIILNATTPKLINTGLGRIPQGWFLIDNMASCNVWRTEPFNSRNITLSASADTTISIWIF